MTALIECTCGHCGEKFSRYRSRLIEGRGTYCSGNCAQKALAPTRERHWRDSFTEALWVPEPNSGCWLWLGHINQGGYGSIPKRAKSKATTAHRAAYVFAYGTIPDGMHILHRCDVRSCVNPAHLYPGTHDDNMRDMISKGRHAVISGAAHGMAKLSADDVLAIRASRETHRIVAARYGISWHNVRTVRKNRTWQHLLPYAVALSQIPPGRVDMEGAP